MKSIVAQICELILTLFELTQMQSINSASTVNKCACNCRIMEAINDTLHVSQIFELQGSESGLIVVGFIFTIVWELLDASLDDEGLLELTVEKKSRWPITSQDMGLNNHDGFAGGRTEKHEVLSKSNTVMAIEIIGELFRDKVTSAILYLVRTNM